MSPERMTQRQKGGDPETDAWEISARKASLVDDVHLVEQFRHLGAARIRQPSGQERLRLQEIAVFVVISRRQIAKSPAAIADAPRRDPSAHGDRCHSAADRHHPSPAVDRGFRGIDLSRGSIVLVVATGAAANEPNRRHNDQQQERERGIEIDLEDPLDHADLGLKCLAQPADLGPHRQQQPDHERRDLGRQGPPIGDARCSRRWILCSRHKGPVKIGSLSQSGKRAVGGCGPNDVEVSSPGNKYPQSCIIAAGMSRDQDRSRDGNRRTGWILPVGIAEVQRVRRARLRSAGQTHLAVAGRPQL